MKDIRSFSVIDVREGLFLLLPSLLTLTRLFITYVLCTHLIAGGWGFPLFSLACLTDVFDGWVARQFHSETSFGSLFDVFADFILVVSTSVFLIWRHLISLWFLGLIVFAFVRFIIAKPRPECDPLGKHIGTVLFVSLGLILALPVPFLSAWSTAIASCYLIASMVLSTAKMKKSIKD